MLPTLQRTWQNFKSGVMNRDKRLVGIVSLADLAIEGSLPKTAKALHGISQPGGQHNQSPAVLRKVRGLFFPLRR